MTITELAVGAAAGYFFVFGTGFVLRPDLVDRFALRWTDPAGKTEVRCYYGAVSWALAGFLVYLLAQDLAVDRGRVARRRLRHDGAAAGVKTQARG